jgi:hypothetical protein
MSVIGAEPVTLASRKVSLTQSGYGEGNKDGYQAAYRNESSRQLPSIPQNMIATIGKGISTAEHHDPAGPAAAPLTSPERYNYGFNGVDDVL